MASLDHVSNLDSKTCAIEAPTMQEMENHKVVGIGPGV